MSLVQLLVQKTSSNALSVPSW